MNNFIYHYARWSRKYDGVFYDTWAYENTPDGLNALGKRLFWCQHLKTHNGKVTSIVVDKSRNYEKVYVKMVTSFD